ncbi:EAL domain-containing protein [Halomonas sp. McH1-25]|uniref:putative bifunctional diguanylate cyclase/phosphodiesterase n=1 Tax=unclassified Halomonas TaxID=2609666 RepID=UPI001EF73B03|nr:MULTISPECIES: GGDEF domain-containing phosphodiesterase [unclassified Halomonas]MCG7601876.1 EAL domain-containing protein [Halomonas sp. McH1-25]MCP1344153.1 EAL domain-containing protein [Halomonas sp. FL8]MCP1363295.1 EAL domain-containing protein [Halomonas sp. BBD45]
MWPSFSLNRPLAWMGLAALMAMAWLPFASLRLACLAIVIVGLVDCWRQVRREHRRRRLSEEALKLSEDGVVITDDRNRIVTVNPAFTQITGYTHDEVRGLDSSALSAGRHDKAFYDRYWQTLHATGRWEGEIWNQRKHGDQFPEWLRVQSCPDERGHVSHYVGLFTDISRHKAREQDLRRIGFEDPLTGLPNRRRLHDMLTSRLQRLRAGEGLDLALIDIDGFKAVNDGLGVDNGDRLLARFGQRLAAFVAGGVVGRLGGDEFMVIRTTTFDDHEKWIASLREHLSEPFELNGNSLRLGLTIGSCRAPEDGGDSGVLFQRLESALYSAKRHGRNHDRRFRPSLEVAGDRQLALVNELRRALAQGGQLELFYQTQHRLVDGALVGMEALLRWRHPEQGMISPADFIPLAERHGLMTALGNWVIERAVAQQASWRASGMPRVPIWVNISALQLIQGDLESRLAAALAQHKVPASMLGLELTESVLLDERAGDISPRLEALRHQGHQIAIDDFGTGYSSMAYLKRLPVDKLKLDRAFIQALPDDRADAAIVVAVLAMARGLHLDVVAEGVETQAQCDFLIEHGCPLTQGFLFARPESVTAIEARYLNASQPIN